jgi:hypothetical protein
MAELVFYVLIFVLLVVASIWALIPRAKARIKGSQQLKIDDFLPIHHREFEDVDRRLSEYDALLQRIQSERREVVLRYLESLRHDFLRVDQLLNRAAKFLPELTLEGESERFWLGIKFRFQYRLARLQMALGLVPAIRLKALTQKVRILATWADKAVAEIAHEHGLRVLQSDLDS